MLIRMPIIVISLGIATLGAPTFGVPISKVAGRVKPNSYIVQLKRGVSRQTHLRGIASSMGSGSSINHQYYIVTGYSATLTSKDLNTIRRSRDIQRIEQDSVLSLQYFVSNETKIEQFGLEQRRPRPRSTKGAGVDVYSLDSGVNIAHVVFGGRAIWGPVFGGYDKRDGNGHGTHTAATAVGNYVGIANAARLIAVKVVGDSGYATTSDVVAGLNWIYGSFKSRRRPSVVIVSLGSGPNHFFDLAVHNAVVGGLHISVAAGNSNVDALFMSPARVPAAVTVGAVDMGHRKASFSNHGSRVDIQAPGVNIRSAWYDGPQSAKAISGTSMAAPYVAGVLAVAISKYKIYHPIRLKRELQRHGRALCVGEPEGTTRLLATEW